MSYSSLARRWRPQTFEDVVGQEVIVQTLQNALLLQRIHPAYLFAGPRGVGKTTLARIFSKGLNCRKFNIPTPKPCGLNCDSCIEIAESRSIDVMEFDAASNTQVERIRERIIEKIDIRPARDRFRVFIIDEVHMLSTSSFNALLKTLEEPPDRVVFIMATTEIHRLPATILSRCQKFYFRLVEPQKIFQRLKQIAHAERIQITDEALWEIVRAGEGSIRDSLSAFDQVVNLSAKSFDQSDSKPSEKLRKKAFTPKPISLEDVQIVLGRIDSELLKLTVEAIASCQTLKLFEIVAELCQKGYSLNAFSNELMYFIRSLLVVRLQGADRLLEGLPFSIQELKTLSSKFTESDLIRIFNQLAKLNVTLRQVKEPRYYLEIGLIRLAEMKRLAPVEQILERIAQIENELRPEKIQLLSEHEKVSQLQEKTSSSEIPKITDSQTEIDSESKMLDSSKTLEKKKSQEKKTFESGSYKYQEINLENRSFSEAGKFELKQVDSQTVSKPSSKSFSTLTSETGINAFSASSPKPVKPTEKQENENFKTDKSRKPFVSSLETRLSAEELEHVKWKLIDDEFEEKFIEVLESSILGLSSVSKHSSEKTSSVIKGKAIRSLFRKAREIAFYHNGEYKIENPVASDNIRTDPKTIAQIEKKTDLKDISRETSANEIIPLPKNPTQEVLRNWILTHPKTRLMFDYMNARLREFGKFGSEEQAHDSIENSR